MGEATCLEGSQASCCVCAVKVQVPPATVTVQMVGTSPTLFGAPRLVPLQARPLVPRWWMKFPILVGRDPLHSLVVDEENPTMLQAAVATLVGQAPQVEVNCQVAEASSPGCQVECGPIPLVMLRVGQLLIRTIMQLRHRPPVCRRRCKLGQAFRLCRPLLPFRPWRRTPAKTLNGPQKVNRPWMRTKDLSMPQVPRFVKFGHSTDCPRWQTCQWSGQQFWAFMWHRLLIALASRRWPLMARMCRAPGRLSRTCCRI